MLLFDFCRCICALCCRLQEACAAAGVPVSLLSGSEVNSSCRQLALPPHRAAGLLQGDGGVLRATTAAAAARQLAAKEGVLMRVSGRGCIEAAGDSKFPEPLQQPRICGVHTPC
jgi:hypothetical protein